MKTTSLTLIPSQPGVMIVARAEFTRTGAIIPADATGAEIMAHAAAATMAMRASTLWAADVCNAMETARQDGKLADEDCADILAQMEFGYAETTRMMTIASVPHEIRSIRLTPAHYQIIGRLCLAFDEQIKWVQIAVASELTPSELRVSIMAGEVKKTTNARGKSTETATMVMLHLRRFKAQLLAGRTENDIDQAEASCLLDELKEVASFIMKLRQIVDQTRCF